MDAHAGAAAGGIVSPGDRRVAQRRRYAALTLLVLAVGLAVACGDLVDRLRPAGEEGEPAATPEATATAEPAPRRLYRVEEGDTLSRIARQYGTTVQRLTELNDIADPERIEEGTLLVLPPAPPGSTPATDEALRAAAERHCPPQGVGSCRAQYLAAVSESEPRALCVSGETRWFFENPQGGIGADCSKDGFTIVAILGGG